MRWEPKCTSDKFQGIQLEGKMRRSAWRPLLVSARLNHCVALNPSPVTSLIHPFIHPVSRTHVRVSRSPTTCTFSPCPALSCSHTHTDSRSLSRWLPHAQHLAFTHLRTLSRLNALPPCAALRCRALTWPHVHIGSLCFAPHCLTLPLYLFVWLSHWFSITLCRSRPCAALTRTTVTITRSHDRCHTDTRFVSYCRTLAHDRD